MCKKNREWSFLSTDENFDGIRLVQEAESAGLEAITIKRGNDCISLCTKAYYFRLMRAGLSKGVWFKRNTSDTPPMAPVVENGKLNINYIMIGTYKYASKTEKDVLRLHSILLKEESLFVKTIVIGVK